MPPRALIPIPANMTVEGSKCVQVNLPADAEWQAMFWGALYQLTAWNSYDRDDVQSGAYCAGIWKSIIDEARASECSNMILFQTSPCELSVSTDGGVTFTPVYNGMLCIQEALNENIIAPGIQYQWMFAYDFTAGGQGAYVPNGTYLTGQGWSAVTVISGGYGYKILDVQVDFPAAGTVEKYEIEFDFTAGEHDPALGAGAGNMTQMGDTYGGTVFAALNNPPAVSPWAVLREAYTSHAWIRLYPGWNNTNSDPGGSALLKRLTLWGTGVNPFA